MYKPTDSIFILTPRRGYIPQLRTSGPIPNPMRVPVSTCLSMLQAGIELYQFNPATKAIIRLTLTNLMDDKKFEKPVTSQVVNQPVPNVLKETEIAKAAIPEIIKNQTNENDPDKSDSTSTATANDALNSTDDSTESGNENPVDADPDKSVRLTADAQQVKTAIPQHQNNGGKRHNSNNQNRK